MEETGCGRVPIEDHGMGQGHCGRMDCETCGVATRTAAEAAAFDPEEVDSRGLYGKYAVRRLDDRDADGEKHHGCRLFVMDVDCDEHAAEAVAFYGLASRRQRPALAADLAVWEKDGVAQSSPGSYPMHEIPGAGEYQQPERFCLMLYRTVDAGPPEVEWLWNSRNAVTPFTILSRDGREMQHRAATDHYAPMHVPAVGDRVFVDYTLDRARKDRRRFVQENWDRVIEGGAPLRESYESREACREAHAKMLELKRMSDDGDEAPMTEAEVVAMLTGGAGYETIDAWVEAFWDEPLPEVRMRDHYQADTLPEDVAEELAAWDASRYGGHAPHVAEVDAELARYFAARSFWLSVRWSGPEAPRRHVLGEMRVPGPTVFAPISGGSGEGRR